MNGPRPFVVVSPGSRSTPLVVALARTDALDVLDVVDERSAAFTALGHARATGRPAFVVCTSGTAPAHWYPAVLEASEAQLPLVLLSADRPTELQQCGAAQTVEQTALFGSHVRLFVDLGDPQSDPSWLAGVRRRVALAVQCALGPTPGPVHVNFRARKPLEPSEVLDATALAASAVLDGILGRGVPRLTTPTPALSGHEAMRVAGRLARAERPLVVLGPIAPTVDRGAITSFLRTFGAPFFAEATSQVRFGSRPDSLAIDALDLVLERPGAVEPDLVVMIGHTPTSGAVERFVRARPALPRIVLGASGWIDPWQSAEEIVVGPVDATLAAIGGALRNDASHEGWLASLRALDAEAWSLVEHELSSAELGEGQLAAATARAVPAGASFLVGNSLPIRLVDRFARGGGHERRVLSQRGVNGIDGLVSAAIGAHRAGDAPVVALLGDLTTLHDVGALASVPTHGAPMVIVVSRNGGGRIFEQLPIATRPELAFAMPHMVTERSGSLADVARAFGHRTATVRTAAELASALTTSLASEGTTLIEAIVPPHDATERETRLRRVMRGGS